MRVILFVNTRSQGESFVLAIYTIRTNVVVSAMSIFVVI